MSATTPYHRDSPILQRTWKNVHSFWRSAHSMVEGLSAPNGEKSVAAEHLARATKRRRITEDSLDSAAMTAVEPLFRDPSDDLDDFERALRVEVLRIGREDPRPGDANGLMNGNGSPVKKDNPVAIIKARCRLTIFRFKREVEMRVIYCDSQTCELKVFRDPDGVCRTARVYLRQPFHVAADKIYIEREDASGFKLADDYLIQTELESAGDPNWPPFDLLQGQEARRPSTNSPRHWVLSSRFIYKYAKARMSTSVVLRKSTGDDCRTDLMMDTDLRWSTMNNIGSSGPTSEETTPSVWKVPLLNGALEPLTNGHVNGRVESLTNGLSHHDDQTLVDDDDGDAEGEAITPSRSLRMRGQQKTYNLKALSDKARGKELKEKKKRKNAARTTDGMVTWMLPTGTRVQIPNWACARCFAEHPSFDYLKAHINEHVEFKFSIGHSPRGGWRIGISRHGEETPRAIRTMEIPEPPSPDDHEDESAPEDISPIKPAPRPRLKPIAKRPGPIKPRQTKQVIPDNNQAMYDRLSKSLFEPGSSVDEPQVDNAWLLQKHREIIKDYTDVHPDEKEYVSAWDAFALVHKTTLSPYLQDIYLEFLEAKCLWLASSQNRMNEAIKHLVYLSARDVLHEDSVSKALGILKDARVRSRHEPAEASKSLAKAEAHSSKSGCAVCGLPVPGPSQLVCSNFDCDRPFFHDECIQHKAKMPVESWDWRCNDCCKKEAAA